MSADKLGTQQREKLGKALQGAMEQCAATLGMMLGGDVRIVHQPPVLRASGVRVWLGLNGALEGGVFLDLPEPMALDAVKRLTAGTAISLLDETARSALMEVGNVFASVFVAYFDQNRGLRTMPTPPELSLAPRELPDFDGFYTAEICWSSSAEKAELLIGFEASALEILLG